MRKLSLFLVPLVLLLVGCATLFRQIVEEPQVKLTEVYVKDVNLTATTVVFVVNVFNPNSFKLEVKGIEYKIFFAEKELASSKTENEFVVPARKSASLEIPLPVQLSALWGNIGQAFLSRNFNYRIEGQLHLSFASVPFAKEGKVDLD